MILQQIIQTTEDAKFYLSNNITIGLWWLGGRLGFLTNPTMEWYNGSTYALGYENKATNNQVHIVKQTGELLVADTVGFGTAVPENLNHPTPLLIIDDLGFIYVIQNLSHIDSFKVWKSDNPEDISVFTDMGNFSTTSAYLGLIKRNGFDCIFISREGGGYDQSIITVSLNDLNGYSKLTISDCDFTSTNIRHYPLSPIRYGKSDYYCGGIIHRKDISQSYFKGSIWITQDFETFENIAQTYSRDVVVSGVLTPTILETNFSVLGTDSDLSKNYRMFYSVQINDDIYWTYRDGFSLVIAKQTIGNATVSTFSLFGGNDLPLYFNGSNIVLVFKDWTLRKMVVYSINLDLTGFKFERIIRDIGVTLNLGLPSNLDKVDDKYLIIGESVNGDLGNVPYLITDNKF